MTAGPPLVIDPDVVRGFLSDAAQVPGGFTSGVVFPRSGEDVAAAVRSATVVLPVGAQLERQRRADRT